MIAPSRFNVLCLVLALTSCAASAGGPESPATGPAAPDTFTYAPALDKSFHHTQRRFEEVSIPGSPMRNSEEWMMEWDVVTKKEGDLFRTTQRLVGLKISVNGLALLKGDEVKGDMVAIDIVTDKDSNVVDVRGAEQLSAALVSLAAPEAKPHVERIFSPERLKALGVARSIERHADFVGRPTKVGSEWLGTDPDRPGERRQIRVAREEPCAPQTCLRVIREYDVDKQPIYEMVSRQVAEYVQAQGGDPSKVQVVGMDLKHEDSLLIDPRTMDYHAASFVEDATLDVAGPDGKLRVQFKLQRDSAYRY